MVAVLCFWKRIDVKTYALSEIDIPLVIGGIVFLPVHGICMSSPISLHLLPGIATTGHRRRRNQVTRRPDIPGPCLTGCSLFVWMISLWSPLILVPDRGPQDPSPFRDCCLCWRLGGGEW